TYTTTLRTFKKFLPQIQNALHYSYSNGPLECLNNHIKVLKRNAYGFRNFYNFKLRIMIRHGKTVFFLALYFLMLVNFTNIFFV
ncbi:transposase, partial [Enterococcus faecium]|uniref:transposase n=1 Tax=Enterococcus faecium TaxID=1352 RepID=UPI000B57FEAF